MEKEDDWLQRDTYNKSFWNETDLEVVCMWKLQLVLLFRYGHFYHVNHRCPTQGPPGGPVLLLSTLLLCQDIECISIRGLTS